MPAETVVTGAPKVDRKCSIEFNFGADLKEMSSLFGENVVYTNAKGQMKVGVNAAVRRLMEAGVPDKEIAVKMKGYKPGVVSRLGAVVTTEAAVSHFEGLTPEAQSAMMAKLQAKQQDKK